LGIEVLVDGRHPGVTDKVIHRWSAIAGQKIGFIKMRFRSLFNPTKDGNWELCWVGSERSDFLDQLGWLSKKIKDVNLSAQSNRAYLEFS
jgi:hypothetical protein